MAIPFLHKAILAARSPIFKKAVLYSPSEDFRMNDNVGIDAIKAFLCFLYSGEISIKELSFMSYELYILCDKYLIASL